MKLLSLVLFILVTASAARSAPYSVQQLLDSRFDPKVTYKTITTSHFQIHYSAPELENLARELTVTAEAVHDRVTKSLNWEPLEKTNIVLIHHSDEPTIFTFVNPHNQIFLDACLPPMSLGLNDFASWYEWILTHEYTHIVHLDRREGFHRALGFIFGSFDRPNDLTPLWMKEGLAVFNESTLTSRGRGGGSTYKMVARMAVNDNILNDPKFAAPDTIASFDNTNWPWTLRPYFMGYYLTKTLQDGDDRNLANVTSETASSLPFELDSALRAGSWGSFDALWNETLLRMQREAEDALAKLKTQRLTPLKYITNTGQEYYGLAISPDGKTLLVTRDYPGLENAIERFLINGDDVTSPTVLSTRSTGYQTSFSRSGRFIAFDQTSRGRRHKLISDIYIYDLKTDAVITISPFLRARDPDIHPDGTHLLFVTNRSGKNRLYISDTSWSGLKDVLGDVGYRRISGPRFSPDGKKIALSLHNEKTGGEDLWLVENGTGRAIVEDGSINQQPSWTRDGNILFSSDRTGVFNIYLYHVGAKRVTRLTNVLGGLFYPVADPSMKNVYAISYRGRGYDVASFSMKDAALTSAAASIREVASTSDPATASGSVSVPSETAEYASWKYLFPQYLRPSLIIRPDSIQTGIDFGASDPLFFQNYDLNVRYDSATQLPVGEFFYFNGRGRDAWDVTATHDAVPLPTLGTTYRALKAAWALNVPLSPDDTSFHLRPGAVYALVNTGAMNQYAGPQMSFRYSTEFKQIGLSFPESGTYFNLGGTELFGIDANHGRVTAVDLSYRFHLPLWWQRHALHLELEGGAFVSGDIGPNEIYTAGGTLSFPYTLGSNFTLYGYPPNELVSSKVGVATLLYTFPFLEIERGLGTAPIFFGRTSAGLRAQAAGGQNFGGVPWGAGVEIHQALLLGHIMDVDAQLGVYQGAAQYGGQTQFFFMMTLAETAGASAVASAGAR